MRSSGKAKQTQDSLGVGVPVDPGTARASHTGGDGSSIGGRGQPHRDPPVPCLPAGQDQPRAGRPAHLWGQPARGRAPPGGGRPAGWGERRLLHPPGAGPAAGGGRTWAPVRPARAANPTARPRRRPAAQRVRPGVHRILDGLTDVPADLRNGRRDLLAANRLGYALYSELYRDPVVGDLELTYEVLALPADPGLSLVVYGAEPGSASQDGLRLLASWAATLDQVEQAATAQAPEDA